MDILSYQASLLKVRFQRAKPRFVERLDCIELIASNGDSCFIDKEDADLASYAWGSTKGYFNRITSRSHPDHPSKTVYLHALILERKLGRLLDSGELGDHIDWDKRNNRRANLRLASKAQNACNSKRHSDATSGYRGVSQAVDTYRVQIQYTVTISRAGYRDPEEAARVYDILAAEHHGKFAVFNFPQEWVYDLTEERYRKL